jgi:sec-independent protein translocase protein TatA
MDLGWPEILLILVVVMIVFGVGKLPQVGGAIGKGIREFRKAQRGDYDDEDKKESEKPAKSETGPTMQESG